MQDSEDEARSLLKGYYKTIEYLQDEGMALYNIDEDASIKLYGSPWQPEFHNWAFNLPRNGEEMQSRWNSIPEDTDILVTHGPAFGHLDIPGGQSVRVGCEMLRHRIDTIRPKIHVCGHIHGSYGYHFDGHTHFFNASVLDERYKYTHAAFTFEWDMKRRLRLSKKDLNIWALTQEDDLVMLKVPFRYRSQFIETFIPNYPLPSADDVVFWLGMMKVVETYQIDL
jgi:hypothetical protein